MKTTQSKVVSTSFRSDEERWQAVVQRDPAADGVFFYSVKTTGVYCRPVCASRVALRRNVEFHETCEDAAKAGFRPCKRCRPQELSLHHRQSEKIEQVCRLIEQSEGKMPLNELAEAVELSPFYMHRLFKAQTGVTPKQYASALRTKRVKSELSQAETVTQAIYGAGYNASSRFYERSTDLLGMTPKTYRKGGQGTCIRFAVGSCWLGEILVAASDKGICAILLGEDADALIHQLQDDFPQAELIGGDEAFEEWIAKVIGMIDNPSIELDLPLDIRGTAFQQQVWNALRNIPCGSTATYAQIAEKIGQPKTIRAVANACANNMLAVAIPCHRVVRTDGSLSGYRWGVQRKKQLLEREQARG